MALTPTQMGTKSRTISAPNPNIRARPNGLGRSPKMGRVQQLAPYQLGELVETPVGLRRIKGVSPITINVDLGPRSTLSASVQIGATSLTVNSFKVAVELNVDVVRRYKGTSTVAKLNGMPRAMLSDLVSVVS